MGFEINQIPNMGWTIRKRKSQSSKFDLFKPPDFDQNIRNLSTKFQVKKMVQQINTENMKGPSAINAVVSAPPALFHFFEKNSKALV